MEWKTLAKTQISGKIGVLFVCQLIIAISGGFLGFFILPALSISSILIYLALAQNVRPKAGDVFKGLDFFGKALWLSILSGFFTWAWSLLLFIPGIIKMVAYSMAPYILADNPDMTAREALRESVRITNGRKGDLFVLQLSFFGWILLIPLTFGLILIWLLPYMNAAHANAYLALRGDQRVSSCPEMQSGFPHKNRLALLILTPVSYILFFMSLPFIRTLLMSFQDYRITGFSPWVGLKNFQDILFIPYTLKALENSLLYGFLPALLALAVCFGAAFLIPLIKKPLLRGFVISVCLLPSFLPLPYLYSDITGWGQASVTAFILLLLTLRLIGPAVLTGAGASLGFQAAGCRSLSSKLAGPAVFAGIGVVSAFFPDPNIIHLFSNSSNSGYTETLSLLSYKLGLMQFRLSSGSAVWMIQTAIQSILGLIAAAALFFFGRRLMKKRSADPPAAGIQRTSLHFPALIAALVCGIILIALAVLLPADAAVSRASLLSLHIAAIIAFCFALLAVPTVAAQFGSGQPFIAAVFVLLSVCSANYIGEYMTARAFSALNTPAAYLSFMAFSHIPFLAMIAIIAVPDYKKAIPYAAGFTGLAIAGSIHDWIRPMLMITNREAFPLSLLSRSVNIQARELAATVNTPLLLLLLGVWVITCGIFFALTCGKAKSAAAADGIMIQPDGL